MLEITLCFFDVTDYFKSTLFNKINRDKFAHGERGINIESISNRQGKMATQICKLLKILCGSTTSIWIQIIFKTFAVTERSSS